MKNTFRILLFFAFATGQARAEELCSNKQTAAQIDARIDGLIGRMTLAEKISQLQDRAAAIPRLGMPGYNWWNEGLHGHARDGFATVFPQAIGLAASFDPELLRAVGETVSTESRAHFKPHADTLRYAGLTIWSPNINIFRDPRWGRGQETYGEDPFLTASLGTQFVEGIQGADSFYLRADATPKHFAAHSGPEEGRDSFNTVASAHDLADTYLPAFHKLTTEARAAALMCSYNAINGVPSCANSLLADRLRGQWGFRGYVVSDCDAVGNINSYHHYAKSAAEASADALNAGTDLDCGTTYKALGEAVSQHLTTEAQLGRSLHRLFAARVRLGMMDPAGCSPYDRITMADNDTAASRGLALRAAEESIVLLRNDGALPLKAGQTIAVIGPTADNLKVLEANYHGVASHPVTPLEGLRAIYPKVRYAQGSALAAGVPAPIPATALRTPTGAPGLMAEYFAQASFGGMPATSKTVSRVDLDLNRAAPDPSLDPAHYAARWTGSFVPPVAGDYTLRVNIERCWDCTTHDRFNLYIDGKLAVANDGAKAEPDRITLHATDIAPHAIRLESMHTGEDEGIVLEWIPPAEAQIKEALAVASAAEVVVAFVGLSPDLEGEALQLRIDGFNGGDRTSLDLPLAQQELLSRLAGLHKKLVVVLTSGSAVALPPVGNAALAAWYPGEEGGRALANILSGRAEPSGRLPVTFYRSVEDLPPFSDYSMAHRTYRYFDGPVLFPFGHGLSYTSFSYGAPQTAAGALQAGLPLNVTVKVMNSGSRAGTTVAQLYVAAPEMPGAPRIALAGLERANLKAGESRTLTFTVSPHSLSFVDAAGNRAIRAGSYRLFISDGQPSAQNKGVSFQIVGEQALQD